MNINNFYYCKRIESYFRTSSFKVACIPLSRETISFVILRIFNFKKYFNYFWLLWSFESSYSKAFINLSRLLKNKIKLTKASSFSSQLK